MMFWLIEPRSISGCGESLMNLTCLGLGLLRVAVLIWVVWILHEHVDLWRLKVYESFFLIMSFTIYIIGFILGNVKTL